MSRNPLSRARPAWRWLVLSLCAGLVLCVVVGLVAAPTGSPFIQDPRAEVRADPYAAIRADAGAAIQALDAGDVMALEVQLAGHRGQAHFAYFFASQATPRALGDALAAVVGKSEDAPLNAGIDAHAYEVALTDLAGTLGLATFGTGDRALPAEWTDDFITATTTPEVLYREAAGGAGDAGQRRADQDLANKRNLLLLLSRGYWSTGFLEAVTDAYWQYDHDKGDDAWPDTAVEDAKLAPAPTGRYLTDGILALSAALTANPEASAWAFTEFQPGTQQIEGSDYAVGKFTHYLLFEHRFPERSDGENLGMTATLTALSSAIDATNGAVDSGEASSASPSADEIGPMHDSVVLQTMAKERTDKSGCSWNPRDYGRCVLVAVEVVWHWIQDWGHVVLDVLSLATFAPPPFDAIGVAAAVTNATWYAIDGDYVAAGLSLAAAIPGLAFGKIAKGAKAGAAAEKAAAEADDIAKLANYVRAGVGTESKMAKVVTEADVVVRPWLSTSTKKEILAAAEKAPTGEYIDANTRSVIRGDFDFGHKPGYEWRCMKAKALALGWTLQELKTNFNNPAHYQIEDSSSNRSRQHESDVCAA